MNIVQTFWSGGGKIESPLEITGSWVAPEYHWMSWTLSCLLLRRHYDHVELFTDEIGKKVLIDILQLPYTKVHIVFDENFVIHPKLFSLAKIRTYSLQQKPFIHVDGDVFLWKRLSDSLLNAELIASNIEKNLFFNKDILLAIDRTFDFIPKHLRKIHEHENIFSSNAGIFGGSNMKFIKQYCKAAHYFIESNRSDLDLVNTGALNFLIEQISLYYLSGKEKAPITYYVQEPVEHPLYQDYLRFIDVPNVNMVHPVGGCKKLPYVLDHLAKRLRLEFPQHYYKIIGLLKNRKMSLHAKFYNYFQVDKSYEFNSLDNSFPEFNGKIMELVNPKFPNAFKRTIKAIEFHFEKTMMSFSELESLMQSKSTPDQLKELYGLEKDSYEKFCNMIDSTSSSGIYIEDRKKYKISSSFDFTKNWMDKEVVYPEAVTLLELQWNWKLFTDTPSKKNLKKIIDSKESSYCVTLSPSILNLEIHETYHEGIDELVLNCVKRNKSIQNITIEASSYFDEHITVENIQYQKLMFDTIKRLCYSTILEIR